MQNHRGEWSSKLGFILAASGSAIGLGNIWRYPYIVGKNGGAAFVVIYLLIVVIIGLPYMLGELSLGRFSQKIRWALSMLLNQGQPGKALAI